MPIELNPHPKLEGYFLEYMGEPIKKADFHRFNFRFKKFSYADVFCSTHPITRNHSEDGSFYQREERKEFEEYSLSIDMQRYSKGIAYSYIGSAELIKNFKLYIEDFNSDRSKHKFRHLRLVPVDYGREPQLNMILFLEKNRVQDIIKRIQENKINDGALSFSVDLETHGDIIFENFNTVRIPSNFLKQNLKGYSKYLHNMIDSFYPYKILPLNTDKDLPFKAYNLQAITDFDLRFEKVIPAPMIEQEHEISPEIDAVKEMYQVERMITGDRG